VTLEQDCVTILAKQMGPAAKIFLDRQCRNYLKKDSSKLEKNDLPMLARCCFIGTQTTLGIVAAETIKKDINELK